jgi:hypothetical protein
MDNSTMPERFMEPQYIDVNAVQEAAGHVRAANEALRSIARPLRGRLSGCLKDGLSIQDRLMPEKRVTFKIRDEIVGRIDDIVDKITRIHDANGDLGQFGASLLLCDAKQGFEYARAALDGFTQRVVSTGSLTSATVPQAAEASEVERHEGPNDKESTGKTVGTHLASHVIFEFAKFLWKSLGDGPPVA